MKEIKKIKSGLFARQFSIAKLAVKTGAGIFLSGDQDLKGKLKQGLEKHLDQVVSELGIMKGSLMKAGQMLSLYSGAFLSPEAQKVLKALENQTSFLDWMVIKKQIPKEWMDELDINSTPIAAASLGQVHMATSKATGQSFVMKIQYEGVRKAIDNDLKSLRWLLRSLGVIPKEMNLDDVFVEIREMLVQETDYDLERATLIQYSALLKDYPQYQAPIVVSEYSHSSILSSSFLNGVSPRAPEVKELSQEKRNFLGQEFLRLLFLELFHWGMIQSDPHFGNYLVMDVETNPHWGLLDFGAIKEPPKDFLKSYLKLFLSCARLEKEVYFETLREMHYISATKSSNDDLLWEYASVFGEPFKGGVYDWGKSDITDKIFQFVPKLMKEVFVGNPPRHAIFLDRKVGGVFFMLKELGAQFDPRVILDEMVLSK